MFTVTIFHYFKKYIKVNLQAYVNMAGHCNFFVHYLKWIVVKTVIVHLKNPSGLKIELLSSPAD